ncbi:hypothetical protein A0257_04990 [Hymenobacter psoromatis]|nr:hypothetical protein A0257_04990 [Hymenobacter psoromatis]
MSVGFSQKGGGRERKSAFPTPSLLPQAGRWREQNVIPSLPRNLARIVRASSSDASEIPRQARNDVLFVF